MSMRLLPDRLKGAAWARWYHPPDEKWRYLFRNAPLRFAHQARMDLVPSDVISGCIAYTGFWELRLSRLLMRLARRGGTMIDVGANLGYFSLLWACAHPDNRCFAFEASPRNADLIKYNIERNHLAKRIRFFPLAAGREKGRLSFDTGPLEQTGWGGFTADSYRASTVMVDVVRVDEAVDAEGRISLLKIDIEGADTWALEGCEKMLQAKRIECIWFEQNKPRMRQLRIAEDAAEKYLRSVGYTTTPRSDVKRDVVDWMAVPAAGGAGGSSR